MSKVKLTNTARTILRARVRSHPDTAKHADPADVQGMSNADLLQLATLLQLDPPTDAETARYEDNKANGAKARSNFADVDGFAVRSGLGGVGLRVGAIDAQVAAAAADADSEDGPADAPTDAPAEAPTDAAQVEAEADKAVRDLQRLMGEGNFDGFRAGLRALAVRAHTPPPAPQVIYRDKVDPAKVSGVIPTRGDLRTALKSSVAAAVNADDDATGLAVYDYPGAPAVVDDYQWPDDTMPALAALASGGNVFLTGPAGTGKTEFARQVAARWGRPFVRISFNGHTEAPVLVGGYGLKDGATVWQDGQLTRAIRKPGTVVLLDEPSFATPGALAVLQALLDDDRAIHIDETGETVRAAPDVLFIAADNTAGTGDESGAYEGTRILNRAFLDRFALTIPVGYLDPDSEAKLLRKRTGLDRDRATALARWAALTRAKADKMDLSHGIGLRRLTALAKALTHGTQPARAFNLTVMQTAPYDDREVLRQLWTTDGLS